jgi:hypothetical protein
LSNVTDVIEEVKNVAVSANPLGTVAGVQLLAVLQTPFGGFNCQVASSHLAGVEQIGLARPMKQKIARSLQNVLINTWVLSAEAARRDTRTRKAGDMPNGIGRTLRLAKSGLENEIPPKPGKWTRCLLYREESAR